VEWLDDVRQWRAGDAAATERLREYVTPFVHGALLAHTPHHVANALMAEVLDTLFANPGQVTRDAGFVAHAVAFARKLAKRATVPSRQERPSTDSTVAEGRQWLERVRAVPEEAREQVLWRLVEGIPGPELAEVLGLDAAQVRTALERGIGDTMVPPQSLAGADYVWDLSGEPSTALARVETYAMALRFDPLAPPEPADVVNTAATFQDLSDAKVGEHTRPEANPFGDFAPTRVHVEGKPKLQPAGAFDDNEKTEGGFDLPAAARGLVPKTEPATPAVKTSGRQALVTSPPPTQRSEPKVAKVDDERPSRRRPPADDERPSRKQEPMGRRETLEAPLEVKAPAQTRVDDDERPSRSRLQVRGKLDRERGEESGRKRNPELGEDSGRRRNPEHAEDSARRRNPEVAEEARRRGEPESRRLKANTVPEAMLSGVTPVGAPSEPSLEPTDPDGGPRTSKPQPIVTEKLVPQPVSPMARVVAIAVGALVLLVAILWRLGVF
jgi:RNA polymerase sigma-70 factor (ECF subfamily)